MQKVRHHFNKLWLIVSIKFQSLFTFAKSFSLFPHGTFHYQSLKFVDFEGGPPILKQYMTCIIVLYFKSWSNVLQDLHVTFYG